jgi:hypothetical protein
MLKPLGVDALDNSSRPVRPYQKYDKNNNGDADGRQQAQRFSGELSETFIRDR